MTARPPILPGATSKGKRWSVRAEQSLYRSRSETSKLRRELGRLDTVCLLIAVVVVIYNLRRCRERGRTGVDLAARRLPDLLCPGWARHLRVGRRLPAGRRFLHLDTACVWALCAPDGIPLLDPVSIWLGGSLTITALTVFGEFFEPLEGIWRYVFALAFIWTAIAVAIAPLSKGSEFRRAEQPRRPSCTPSSPRRVGL